MTDKKKNIYLEIRRVVVLSCLLLWSFEGFAQFLSGYEASFSGGYVLPHHQEIAYYVHEPLHAGSVRLFKKGAGASYWHQLYKYPEWGMGLHYSTLGNAEVFGKAYALYGYFNSHFIHKPHWQAGSRISFGMAYLTKAFDLETNYRNYAIGSRLNIYFKYSLENSLRIFPKTMLTNSIGFTHYSNGKVKIPNKGLNGLFVSVGLKRYLHSPEIMEEQTEAPPFRKNEIALYSSFGWKEISLLYYQQQFNIVSATADYFRHHSHRGKYGAGIDLFYDQSLKTVAVNNGTESPDDSYYYKIGAHLSYAWKVSDLQMIAQLGHYLHAKVTLVGSLYTRLGLRYQFCRHVSGNLTLKAHKAKADFVEFGIGLNHFFE